MDDFLRHYLIAAIWTATVDNDDNIDQFDVSDFSPAAIESAKIDCEAFQTEAKDLLELAYQFYDNNGNSSHPDAGSAQACAGHDFWLTRNGHGVGFWDRGMGEVGDKLSDIATKYREVYVFVSDDGVSLGME